MSIVKNILPERKNRYPISIPGFYNCTNELDTPTSKYIIESLEYPLVINFTKYKFHIYNSEYELKYDYFSDDLYSSSVKYLENIYIEPHYIFYGYIYNGINILNIWDKNKKEYLCNRNMDKFKDIFNIKYPVNINNIDLKDKIVMIRSVDNPGKFYFSPKKA